MLWKVALAMAGYGGGGTTGAMAIVENTLTSDHQNYVLPTPERGSSWVSCLKFEALNAIQGTQCGKPIE